MESEPERTEQEIEARVDAFGAALQEALGSELLAVLVYGSLAKGDYTPGASDHNVALILEHDQAHTLRQIAEVMRSARPSRRTTLLLLTREELARARDVFPLKLRDLCLHHRLVCGSDAELQACELAQRDLARDCEQQLRSLSIRSRRLFLRGTSNPDLLRHNLTISYKGMLPPLAGLVELCTGRQPVLHEEIVREACELLGEEPQLLLELHRWQREPDYEPAESRFNQVLDALLNLLRAAAQRADSLHEAHVETANEGARAGEDTEAAAASEPGEIATSAAGAEDA